MKKNTTKKTVVISSLIHRMSLVNTKIKSYKMFLKTKVKEVLNTLNYKVKLRIKNQKFLIKRKVSKILKTKKKLSNKLKIRKINSKMLLLMMYQHK